MLSRSSLFKRYGVSLLAVFTVAVTTLLCYQVGLKTFHHAFLTSDEGSYVFQANNFLEGRIAREAPAFGRSLQHQMVIQDIDVGWLSRYPPLHSLWLVPGVAIGKPYMVPALTAGLSLLFIMLTLKNIGVRAGPVIVLLLCSPYFIFMHGTLLSHTSGLACTSLMLLGYISWMVSRKSRWLVVTGTAWGLLFMGRPYTAFLLAIPFGIASLLELNRQRDRKTLNATLVFVLSSLTGVIGLLTYNYYAVGDPFTMTFFYYDPTEGLGFGLRHTLGDPTYHTLERGTNILWNNLKSLDQWMLGWRGSLVVMMILVLAGWHKRITPLLLGGIIILPVGYLFFWYEGIDVAGPVYYFESLPFVMIGAALGVTEIEKRIGLAARWNKVLSIVVMTILIFGSLYHSYYSIQAFSPEYEYRRKLRRIIDSAPPQSIVLIPTVPVQLFLMLNAQGLASEPLVIRRYPGEWQGLLKLLPEHSLYRLVRGNDPHLKKVKLRKPFVLDLPTGSKFYNETGEFSERDDGGMVIAKADKHTPGVIGSQWLSWLYPGTFKFTFKGTISATKEPGEIGAAVDITEYQSDILLASKEFISTISDQLPATFCLEIEEPKLIEARILFTGSADVEFKGLRLEEAKDDC